MDEQRLEKVIEMMPDMLGKILIELNCDTNQYNVGFSNPETAKVLKQVEIVNMMSPFHAACIINEIKRRKEGSLIKPAGGIILH